jgi:hypothetical protein
MAATRGRLPAAKQRAEILSAVAGAQVMLPSVGGRGTAGCGQSHAGPSLTLTPTSSNPLLRHAQVMLLSGETGCGKTTQVPQFILEEAIAGGRGGRVNILCTQPRRIAATGVATRVAAERCEPVGDLVGYKIRLENRVSARTRLTFCTTGVLLRRLHADPLIGDVTHVIVDEVRRASALTLPLPPKLTLPMSPP